MSRFLLSDVQESKLRPLKSFSSSQEHPRAEEFLRKFEKNVTDGKHLLQTVKYLRSKMMRFKIPLAKSIWQAVNPSHAHE